MSKATEGPLKNIEVIKVILPLLTTSLIAAVGWNITSRHNATQLRIGEEKNLAELEIAKTNAGLRYLEIVKEISGQDAARLNEAQSIAVAVLPSELSFQILHDNVETNPSLFPILLSNFTLKGQDEMAGTASEQFFLNILPWFRRMPFDLVHPYYEIKAQTPEWSESSEEYRRSLQSYQIEDRRTQRLFQLVVEAGLEDQFFSILIDEKHENKDFRDRCLYRYYRGILKANDHFQDLMVKERLWNVIERFIADPKFTESLKSDMLTAFCLANYANVDQSKQAAQFYWAKYDVNFAEHPPENDLRWILYERFTEDLATANFAPRVISEALYTKLSEVDFRALDSDQTRLILYYYAQTHRSSVRSVDGKGYSGHFAYLFPKEIVGVMRLVLAGATTAEKRKSLSRELGSLSGSILFHNVARNDAGQGRAYSLLMLEWYESHQQADWYIPKFFHEVEDMYADLAERAQIVRTQRVQ